jgi:hypothetical protein
LSAPAALLPESRGSVWLQALIATVRSAAAIRGKQCDGFGIMGKIGGAGGDEQRLRVVSYCRALRAAYLESRAAF